MRFLLAFGIAVLLTPVARWVGLRFGVLDHPGDDLKIHRRPASLLGGLAVVAGTFGAQAILGGELPWPVTAAVLVALVAGLADDIRPLPAWVRVLSVSAAGPILIAGGTGLENAGVIGAVGLVLLVLVCANGVNIVDGQDGLAAGLAAVGALGLTTMFAVELKAPPPELGFALAGALLGFLVWNRPPAAGVFLGNGGAYATGTLLAILAAGLVAIAGVRGLVAAGVCLGIFAFEVGFTVARRTHSGLRFSAGDRFHSYDLLAALNGRTASTVTMWVLGVMAAGYALLISILPLAFGLGLVAIAVVAAAAWGVRLWSRSGYVIGGRNFTLGAGWRRSRPGLP